MKKFSTVGTKQSLYMIILDAITVMKKMLIMSAYLIEQLKCPSWMT